MTSGPHTAKGSKEVRKTQERWKDEGSSGERGDSVTEKKMHYRVSDVE